MTTRFTSAFIAEGTIVKLVAPYAVSGGSPALVGSIFGVATADVASGDSGEFMVEGVFYLAKTTSQAWTQGQKLYWNDSTKKLTTDSTLGELVGACTVDAGSADTFGYIRLNESVPNMIQGAEAAVADLVDSSGGATADGTIGVVTVPTALTGAGSGTANGALEAEGTVSTAGGNTYADAAVNTVLAKIENNIMELATSQTANITAITANRDAVKELATKVNALLAALRLNGIIAP